MRLEHVLVAAMGEKRVNCVVVSSVSLTVTELEN